LWLSRGVLQCIIRCWLLSRLHSTKSAQGAQQPSASSQSTPSNLESAVLLLLEAETESVSGDSKVSAAASAVDTPSKPAGESAPGPPTAGVIYTGDTADRMEGSSAPEASLQQQGARKQSEGSVTGLGDVLESTDLGAQQSALRKVNTGNDTEVSMDSRDSPDEGPSTPPASNAAVRANTKASSSPNSTAGKPLPDLQNSWPWYCGQERIRTTLVRGGTTNSQTFYCMIARSLPLPQDGIEYAATAGHMKHLGETYHAGDPLERLPPLPCEEPGRKEMQYYATCINHRLRKDTTLTHILPLKPSSAHIASACRDGILLW